MEKQGKRFVLLAFFRLLCRLQKADDLVAQLDRATAF